MSRFGIVSVALVSLLLAACASTPTPPPVAGSTTFSTDLEYVATVEDKARRRGVAVVWINPPKSRHVHLE